MHRGITRRDFLQVSTTLTAAGITAPIWLRLGDVMAAEAAAPTAASRKLIVLLLSGGNDGLNTVVPYGQGAYYSARPSIAVPPSQALKLHDSTTVGLNPDLANLHTLYEQGQVAILQGIGYDNPDLSHFSSMDIWQSGSPTHAYGTGWIGRYLDATPDRAGPVRAVAVGNLLPQALVGASTAGVAIPSFGAFQFVDGADVDTSGDGFRLHQALLRSCAGASSETDPVLQWLLTSETSTVTAVRDVAHLQADPGGPASLADAVQMAMAMLSSDLGTDIAFLTLASFDEHGFNGDMHNRLLQQVDAAIGRFAAVAATTAYPDTYLLCTFSEFGRRVAENGDRGTDHGTAAPQFVVGRRVAGGLYGAQPLVDPPHLDANGNLVRQLELRELYATLIDGWLGGASSQQILGYSSTSGINPVPFLRTVG
jgi:uncharacterized protein (DUF1501 family)